MRDYNKLIKEIKVFSHTIPGNQSLNSHQRQTVIHDCLLKLIKKEEEGKLDLSKFKEYKGYMFLTVRNEIYRIYDDRKNTRAGRSEKLFIDDLNLDEPSYQMTDYYELKAFIQNLPPIDRAILRWMRRGWTQEFLCNHLSINDTTFGRRLKKIRTQLVKQFD